MRAPHKATIALGALTLAAAARAWDGSSTTLFDSRPYARDGKAYAEAPLYEQFSLTTPAEQLGPAGDLRVVLRAWGRGGLGDPIYGDHVTGDIDVAYVEGSFLNKRLDLRLGRQFISEGAFRGLQMDGAEIGARILPGLGVQAFGGVPVIPRLEYEKGDAITGARIYYRPGFEAELAASVLYALQNGDVAREDAAVDLYWRPERSLTFGGNYQWSLIARRTEEARGLVQWQPDAHVQFTVDGRRTAPDLFIPRTSIFSVFSEERRDELGGEVALRLGPRLTAYGDYHKLYVDGGQGDDYGGKVTFKPSRATTTYGLEVRRLLEPTNGYLQIRGYWMSRIYRELSATLEVDSVRLDQTINGHRGSLVGTASLSYPATAALDLMAGASAGTTPYLDRRLEFVVRAVYRFGDVDRRRP